MKVMILMQDPQGGGGAEKVMAQLTHALGNRVDFVIVYASIRNPDTHEFTMQAKLIEADMRWLEASSGICSKAGKLLHRLRELHRIIHAEQPDIVLSNFTYIWHHLALILRLFRVINVPLLLRFGNPVSADLRARGRLYTIVMRFGARIADGIIANSQGLGDDILQTLAFPAHKLYIINNPIPVAHIRQLAQEPVDEFPFDQNIPIVVNVGRLATQKNQALLIRAFQQMSAQQPANLVLIGDGNIRTELETLVQTLQIKDSVCFLGWRDNPYKYLQRATVFVLSSNFEGFPSALVEAMALGCPVISTDCPFGPSEILQKGEYGLLVPVEDQPALEKALLRLLTSERQRTLYQNRGIERANEFNVDILSLQYLNLFKKLSLSKSKPGHLR